jgi:tetratricopeptide (TPR) repeat protein
VAELLLLVKAMTLATCLGTEFSVAQMYRLYIVMHLDAREYETALGYAMAMLGMLKDLESEDRSVVADEYNATGLCMLGIGDYDGAEKHLRCSLVLRKKFPNWNAGICGITLANLVLCHNLKGQHAEALELGNESLKLVEEHLGKGSFKAAE